MHPGRVTIKRLEVGFLPVSLTIEPQVVEDNRGRKRRQMLSGWKDA
jgi:hypothetical protein